MQRHRPRRDIPGHRKTLFYVGSALSVAGLLLFFSTFVTACSNFGDFTNFDGKVKSQMATGLFGMVLIVVGGILANIGRRGLAGSGAVIDPEQARVDLEPWSRMVGGMAKDALDETGLAAKDGESQVVKVRCPACKALNDEHDRFCGQCGKAIA